MVNYKGRRNPAGCQQPLSLCFQAQKKPAEAGLETNFRIYLVKILPL
jgi:hypothetical protein